MAEGVQVQPAPLQGAEIVKAKIIELQSKMQTMQPGYETLLQQIHYMLQQNEDIVHILSEEEVGAIVAGLSMFKNVVIAQETKKSTRKKLSTVTEDDI